jgi:hypothetical protein
MEINYPTGRIDPIEFLKSFLDVKISDCGGEGTLYAGMPYWFSEVDDRLHSFSQLADNWDSYGASPIDESLIRQAIQLLKASNLDDFPKPFVVPRKDGGINFEWDIGEKFLSLEIRKGGMEYFFFDRKDEKSIEKKYKEQNLDFLIKKFL